MTSSDINVRPVEPQDFNQVIDLYTHHQVEIGLLGNSLGRGIMRSYLKGFCAGSRGSLLCAFTKEGRLIGTIAWVFDWNRFKWYCLRRNLPRLGPLAMVRFFSSSDTRGLILTRFRAELSSILTRLRAKPRYTEKKSLSDNTVNIPSGEQRRALSKWLVVDKAFRGGGKDVASLLIASLEKDLKKRGVTRAYGEIERKNLASVFIHLKNGWQIMHKDDKYYLAVKDL